MAGAPWSDNTYFDDGHGWAEMIPEEEIPEDTLDLAAILDMVRARRAVVDAERMDLAIALAEKVAETEALSATEHSLIQAIQRRATP